MGQRPPFTEIDVRKAPAPDLRNVLGGPLQPCCTDPVTGFHRDGTCWASAADRGLHVVCAEVTSAFLTFSLRCGNDLVTPRPEYQFLGLRPGQRWCLCAQRWLEATHAGVAPPVDLEATQDRALSVVALELLKQHARPAGKGQK